MKTKIEIIDEVVSHIWTQGRAIDKNGECVYQNEDGKVCGHSLFLTDKARIMANGPARELIELNGDSIHKEEYRGHAPIFWKCIQELHDLSIYWNKDGTLTSVGLNFVVELKLKYND